MSLRENLKKHIASIHEDEKPYKCAICDYKCSEKGNLTKHIKSVHDGIEKIVSENNENLVVEDDNFTR